MAVNDAHITGVENVNNWFEKACETHNTCKFSLYEGKLNICSYHGNDIDKAKEVLNDNLTLFAGNDYRNICNLRIYGNKTKFPITEKTEPDSTIKLRCVQYHPSQYINGVLIPQHNQNNEIITKLNSIESRLNAVEEEEEEEEPEADKISGTLGMVTTLLENPIIAGIVSKFLNFGNVSKPNIILSGTETENNLQSTLIELKKFDPDLENDLLLLLNMARNNQPTFNMLIGMLRKM